MEKERGRARNLYLKETLLAHFIFFIIACSDESFTIRAETCFRSK